MMRLLLLAGCSLVAGASDIPLDFSSNATGRRFDGIGGLSGGGATSSKRWFAAQHALAPCRCCMAHDPHLPLR